MIDSFSFEVPHPWWLASLILIVPLLAYYYWRSLSDFPLRQRVISFATRTAITILLAFALAGLALLRPTQQQFVIFAIDQSLSVDSANDEQLRGEGSKPSAKPSQVDEYLDRVFSQSTNPGDHKVMYLPFAAQAGTLTTERPKSSTEQPSKCPAAGSSAPALPPALDRNATDIAAAIRSAAGAMPPDYVPRIVLLTDGNQTGGDVLQAALGTASLVTTDRKTMSGNNTPGSARDVQLIPIDTVPLKVRDENEVQVAAVDVPAQVREGEPFYVEVVINSNHEDEGLVEVFRGAHKVLSETRKLKAGESRFRFQQSITGERLAQYTVKVGGLSQDTLLDNNTESGLVFTTGKPRVLLIESEPKLAQQLVWALQQEEIECDVRPVEGMPESLADLQNYELLVLSNIPATSLSQRQMELARTYVQDLGGGFMMLGGDQSFGLGGYYKTVLEEILPVRSDFEKEKEKPSLGMVLVIDKSGSMGGEKIEMAKEAAKSAAELLGPRDQLGVIAFDGDFYWVSDLQSAGNKGRIID
ncbi:VWA domain-containing protein, partial [Schlesneria sp.]|uniref:VWA domain-containing protein n=1 Tax=Schlesneria sp. TaxID=2762018 RepID=UPI002EF06FB1